MTKKPHKSFFFSKNKRRHKTKMHDKKINLLYDPEIDLRIKNCPKNSFLFIKPYICRN
jgi:hypothetical protein